MENNPDTHYNLKELRAIAAGDEAFLMEMIRLFISQNEASFLEINMQLAAKNYTGIKTILHKMKPSIMVMGVTAAAGIIVQIEQMYQEGVDEVAITALLGKLATVLTKVNEQLRPI